MHARDVCVGRAPLWLDGLRQVYLVDVVMHTRPEPVRKIVVAESRHVKRSSGRSSRTLIPLLVDSPPQVTLFNSWRTHSHTYTLCMGSNTSHQLVSKTNVEQKA